MKLPVLASPALRLSEVATPISPNFCSSHPRTLMRLGVCFAALAATAAAQGNVSFAWATVDNPGNADDLADGNAYLEGVQNFGGVNSTYRIAKHEVTNSQYAAFLNAVDAEGSNPNGLYSAAMNSDGRGGIQIVAANATGSKYVVKENMGNKPVNFIDWFDAARFANWMHNGQGGAGSTESGAYDMTLAKPERMPGAVVFLPSEDEWYKAAYFDPATPGADAGGSADYWKYPTMSDEAPEAGVASNMGDIANPGANVANYNCGATWSGYPCQVTTVGSAETRSFYGAFDMGGNVWEWTEADTSLSRGLRGGGARFTSDFLDSSSRGIPAFGDYTNVIGFRIATLPERTQSFAPESGPHVPNVAWTQIGAGTGWTGSGRTATFVGELPREFDDTGMWNPQSPAPWMALEARVVGPGVFSFHWSEPVRARGGREADYAKCTFSVNGDAVATSPLLADRQEVVLGPGLHRLRWTPRFGEPYWHIEAVPATASFTLSDLSFLPSLTVSEALDSSSGEWQSVGGWTSYFAESAAGQDAVWSDVTDQPNGFAATVTGPGSIVLDGLILVSWVERVSGWRNSLRPVRPHPLTLSLDEGSFRITIDQSPPLELASGQVHRIPVGPGQHQIAISARKGLVQDSLLDGAYDFFRAQINTLQFVPIQPADFAVTTVSRDPTTSEVTLGWSSEPGKQYKVWQSMDLVSWTELPAIVDSLGSTTTTAVIPPAGTPSIYYTIRRL